MCLFCICVVRLSPSGTVHGVLVLHFAISLFSKVLEDHTCYTVMSLWRLVASIGGQYYTSDKVFVGLTGAYCNFRTFTRTADYPQRSIFVVRGKKVQQITRTGLLTAPQNKRKSCYCITGIRTHKLGAMNIPCCCLIQSESSMTFSAKNWLLTMQP